MKSEDQIIQLNEDCLQFVHEQLDKDQVPLAIAAVLAKVALQIYKTTLTEEGFNAMIEAIVENSNRIMPLAEKSPRTLN
jgi:3-methyladenine DNA glycosylase/8-oxoguanine DNA glycosylase